MLLAFINLACITIASAAAIGFRLKYSQERFPHLPVQALLLGLFLIILFGAVLTPIFSFKFSDALKRKKWPTIDGVIVSSQVVGERAFRPNIEFRYIVNGDTLFANSFMNQPGFGGRMNRLDAAEKIVQKYKPGAVVKVYFDPANPLNATLSPNPTYAMFLKLGTSSLLYLTGLIILFLWRKKPKATPIYRERI